MLVLFVTLIAAVLGNSSACDSCGTDYFACMVTNCASDFEDIDCTIAECEDEILSMAQCNADNMCPEEDNDCVACSVEVYTYYICGTKAGCDFEADDGCVPSSCTSELGDYMTCAAINGCEDEDDADDDDCPACNTQMQAFGLCINDKCTLNDDGDYDPACYMDKCLDKYSDYMVCAVENGCDDDEVCSPECADEYVDQIVCFYDKAPASLWDSGEDPTHAQLWDFLPKCSSKIEKMNQCMYDNCLDDYDIGVMSSLCDSSDCSKCYTLPDPMAYAWGECTVEFDEDDYEMSAEIYTCVNSQVCTETWEDSTTCTGTSSSTCYDNDFCMDMGDGYASKYTWYGGCGAEEYEGGSSASAAMFVVVAFVTQMFMW